MRDEILDALKALEAKEECKILFAAESGSRAWGFASPDSDYDIRVIYAKPEAWYWDIAEKQRDTFEAMLPGDLDISAWEVRKALRQFAKCNLALNEWIGSPIIYTADANFLSEMRRLLPEFFNPIRGAFHYLSLSRNAWDTINEAGEITYKKLFYALRGLFCALWCVKFRSMPPTPFEKLLNPKLIPEEILAMLPELHAQKQKVNEKARLVIPDVLREFCLERQTYIKRRLANQTFEPPSYAPLNQLLQRCVKQKS